AAQSLDQGPGERPRELGKSLVSHWDARPIRDAAPERRSAGIGATSALFCQNPRKPENGFSIPYYPWIDPCGNRVGISEIAARPRGPHGNPIAPRREDRS